MVITDIWVVEKSPSWLKVSADRALSESPWNAVEVMPVICVCASAWRSVEFSAPICVAASAATWETDNALTSVVFKPWKKVVFSEASVAGEREVIIDVIACALWS